MCLPNRSVPFLGKAPKAIRVRLSASSMRCLYVRGSRRPEGSVTHQWPYGVRSLSKYHLAHPYVFSVDGHEHRVDYMPADSATSLFGGNSNWRGPVWLRDHRGKRLVLSTTAISTGLSEAATRSYEPVDALPTTSSSRRYCFLT